MLHSTKPAYYRFNYETPGNIPLSVRSVGHYTLVPHSQIEPPAQKWFCEIFWNVKGAGEFQLNKKTVRLKGSEIFYHLPGEIHALVPVTTSWEYRWLTLDHPSSSTFLEGFGFHSRPFPARECPIDLFQKLEKAVQQENVQGDRLASHFAHAILLAASEGKTTTDESFKLAEHCKKKIDEHYTDHQLNVENMAQSLGIHRSTLFRSFSKSYGMSPSQYLQSKRLHHAIALLKTTRKQIQEIAIEVGVSDSNYLARLIHKTIGHSPRAFREMHIALPTK